VKPAAEKVQAALTEHGLDRRVIELDVHARTSQQAADALGVTVGQIVKSLVFTADGRPLLVVASGANRVEKAATGYTIGGVPPIGLASPLAVYVDRDLLGHELVYAAAGLPECVFPLAPAELVRVTGGQVVDGERSPRRRGMRLKDKVALVTGAGSGIGQATATLFAREGAKVAVVDVREDAAKATAEQIERSGGQALAIRADVSRSADNQAAVQQSVARWGRLDIFYANAGVPQFPTPVENVDEAVFDQIMAVNVKGVFLAAKHVAPVFRRQKGGVLLITGSTSGVRPRPGVQCYSASKGAVHTLAASLGLEFAAYGARVVAIAPVATETPMLATFMGKKQVDEEGMTRYRGTVPLGRLNKPEDLAAAALFLASDEAAMITGSVFPVDGGRCI
jgi:3-oxoacyl-[acyl-carrier protein] reductase